MIVDSDVLIWYFRGNENAKILFDNEKNVSVSAVSYMELFQGARNKCELAALDDFFTKRKISTVQIDKKISTMAIAFVKKICFEPFDAACRCSDCGNLRKIRRAFVYRKSETL